MFDFFLTEAKSRGMLPQEQYEIMSLPTTAAAQLNASPSQQSGVIYGNQIIKSNRQISQRRKVNFNKPIALEKQKAPSANYIFN